MGGALSPLTPTGFGQNALAYPRRKGDGICKKSLNRESGTVDKRLTG